MNLLIKKKNANNKNLLVLWKLRQLAIRELNCIPFFLHLFIEKEFICWIWYFIKVIVER